MTTTTFDPNEGPSTEQMEAEAAALAQGEALAQAAAEDKARRESVQDDENTDVALIGGKFKSQDDLLKAYEELQRKMSSGESSEEEESEEVEEAPAEEQEVEATEVTETVNYMHQLNQEVAEKGELSEEAIEKLASMDSKELIKAYMQYNAQAQSAAMQQSEIDSIQASVGGPEAYAEMIQWAGQNLPQDQIDDFNSVTATNNPQAIRFAVQSLSNAYRNNVGYEAPLVTGKKASSKSKSFRSHAELSRAIADPRYSTDPAYRADVEEKLSRSTDLL